MFKKITLSTAAALAALTAMPAAAEAQSRNGYYDGRYQQSYQGYDRGYEQSYRGYNRGDRGYRRCSGTTGTIIGGAGGALLGREIAGRRNSTTGTLLGAAAGALLGRQVGKSSCRG